MKKLFVKLGVKKIFIAVFGFAILLTAFLLVFFGEKMENNMLARLSDALSETARTEMATQMGQTTSLALAVASNELLAKSLDSGDRVKASYIIDTVLSQFENYGETNKFWVQLHTADLKVFLRSWDKSDYGSSLGSFRKGLVYVRDNKRPFASIELGKKLNIKSIAPVKLGDRYVGSLEIIKNFDDALQNLKKRQISLFVLMDKTHLDVAEWMRDYPTLGDFVICHREYDEELYEELKKENIYSMIGGKKSFTDSYFLSFEPLRDINGERLGFFVVAIPKSVAITFLKSNGGSSFFASGVGDGLSADYKTKAKIASNANQELKKIDEFEEKKMKIKNMSKSELENMVLYGDKIEIKKGEVR